MTLCCYEPGYRELKNMVPGSKKGLPEGDRFFSSAWLFPEEKPG
jgi:hypothetical protein